MQTINLPAPLKSIEMVVTAAEVQSARPINHCEVQLRTPYDDVVFSERVATAEDGISMAGGGLCTRPAICALAAACAR
jgi:hypothetical protein